MADSLKNLIVNYIPQCLEDYALKAIFSGIGEVDSCKIMKDHKTGYSYGFGFVSYVNPEDAQTAIQKLNGLKIVNKHIKVAYARPSDESIKGANLYITNLPRTTTVEELNKLFGAFGEIIKINILKDKYTGLPRGVAFVLYSRKSEAELAIRNLDGLEMPGSCERLSVKFAFDKSKRASYFVGYQAGQRYIIRKLFRSPFLNAHSRPNNWQAIQRSSTGTTTAGVHSPLIGDQVPPQLVAYPQRSPFLNAHSRPNNWQAIQRSSTGTTTAGVHSPLIGDQVPPQLVAYPQRRPLKNARFQQNNQHVWPIKNSHGSGNSRFHPFKCEGNSNEINYNFNY
uniref:RRM domain-containing protein n=2 Tax=Graphocephala atropunctata TaxID=36148 RepID=A0A1B6KB81_9HEMI